MTEKLLVILPLPHASRQPRWNRALPETIIPNGLKAMAAIALANIEDVDAFVEDAYRYIEHYGFDCEGELGVRYARLMCRQSFQDNLTFLLEDFFEDFKATTLPIIGEKLFHFERVVSYRCLNGICVEFSHVPQRKLSHPSRG